MTEDKGYVTRKEHELLKLEVNQLSVRMGIAETNIKGIQEDISEIKDNTKWIIRILIGGIIAAVLAMLFNGGTSIG